MYKKVIALFLTVLTVISFAPFQVLAENDGADIVSQDDYSVTATNSIGEVVNDVINESQSSDNTDPNTHICDINVESGTADVSLICDRDCTVMISIIDDDTKKEVAHGAKFAPAGSKSLEVNLNTETIPDSYVIEADVLDTDSDPIGSTYVDTENTEWYQEFQDLTTEDFDSDLVLNLDYHNDNNFMVLNESVVSLDDSIQCDKTSDDDDENQVYNFYCDKEDFAGIKKGSTICYNKSNVEEMVLGKVEKIKYQSNYIEVTTSKATVEDCFQIIKIHYDSEEYAAENQELPSDIKKAPKKSGVNTTLNFFKKDFLDTKYFKISLSGSLKIGIDVDFSLTKKYIKASLSLTPRLTLSAEASVTWLDKEKLLQWSSVPTGIIGLSVDYKLYFYAKGKVKGSFNPTIQKTFKWSYSNKEGFKDLSTAFAFTGDFKVEASFEFGLKPYVSLAVVHVLNLGYTNSFGISISASQTWQVWNTGTEKHSCNICIDGDINFVWSQSARIEIFAVIWSWHKEIPFPFSAKVKLGDFYWSIDHGEIGFGECPHKAYKITVKVIDQATGKTISGAKVNGKATSNGAYTDWFENEQHTLDVKASGYVTKKYNIGVDSATTFTVKLQKAIPGVTPAVDYETDGSYSSYRRRASANRNGYSTYVAPLTFTEPAEGVVLSTRLAGQRRSDVAWVQRELKNLGYSITADGYYGNATASVVKQFQADYSLPITGTVNANVVAVIKKPIKRVTAPTNLKLTTPEIISAGEIATITWDSVANASAYDVRVYNASGVEVDNEIDTKSTVASFVLYAPDSYTVKIIAKNERFISPEATLGTTIKVRSKLNVLFKNWDGTVLSKQFIEYGQAATTPASPERFGYTFNKWDTEYSKVTDNLVVTALYTKNQYKVTFLDTDGSVLSSEKCYFEEAATAPTEDKISIPTGCKLIGWDKDFSCIIEDTIVKPVVQYANDDLPIIIEDNYAVTKDGNYGYDVSLTVRNYDKARTNGRIVVALKTADGRFVTSTESSAFTLKKSNFSTNTIARESFDIFIPCSEEVAYVNVFVVAAYDVLIPISKVKTIPTNAGQSSSVVQSQGVDRTISGSLDSSLAGKQAILFIYKHGDAADYTNEYIGQTEIAENGDYRFDYKLREEPSISTGDYTVVLGVEGAKNTIYLDKIEAPKPVYTVTIKDFDGKVLSTQQVQQGQSAVLPEENPERAGYTFAGWDYTNSSIYEDLTITAIYVPKQYTVVFIDWTNRRFDMETYRYGERLIAPDLSTLDDYNTLGWEGVAEGTVVTQNMVITAKYEKKTYIVKFYDYENNVIDEQVIEYGEEAEIPVLTDDESHVFYEWDSEELKSITQSLEIHPRFRYVEDTAIPTASIDSGIYTDCQELVLTDEVDGAIIYYSLNGGEFTQYSSPIQLDTTTEISYYATSLGKNNSETISSYYIINKDVDNSKWLIPYAVYDGEAFIGTFLVKNGTNISDMGFDFTKQGYIFDGLKFEDGRETTAITLPNEGISSDYVVDVVAHYTPIQYNVTFLDEKGEVIDTQIVNYLEDAIPPESVAVPEGYIFIGWNSDDYYCVTDNTVVQAVMENEKTYASLKLSRDQFTMMEGFEYTLSVQTNGINGEEIFWESSDESLAQVDANGRVTALADGVVVITASIPSRKLRSSCYITITPNATMSVKLIENASFSMIDHTIIGISPSDNTVESVLSQIESERIKFFDDAVELSNTDTVSTGTTIKLYNSENEVIDEVTLVVVGDVDGDGRTSIADASHIVRSLIGKESMEGIFLMAADVNADGDVNNKDASLIMRFNVNKETL